MVNILNLKGPVKSRKTSHLSTESLSTTEMPRVERSWLKSISSTINLGNEKMKQSIKFGEKSSLQNQPLSLNTVKIYNKKDTRLEAEVEGDLNEEDIIDTLVLRNNLNAKILTENKNGLFNNKMKQFNNNKNKIFQSSNNDPLDTTNPIVESDLEYDKLTIEIMHQGPKTYFSTKINSPQPKDNSFEDINDVLFDALSETELNSLVYPTELSVKDNMETHDPFERNSLSAPIEKQTYSLNTRLFSKQDYKCGNREDIYVLYEDKTSSNFK